MFKFVKTKKFLILATIIIAVLGGGFLIYKKNTKETNRQKFAVKEGEVEEELILSGTIWADEYVKLNFPIAGKISWVGVKEGQEVKKGQALMKLDTLSLNADYQRALADLRAAEATVQKIHDDVKGHSADETFTQKETRTDAEVAKDKAYEAVKKAQQNLRDATLYSPFSGFVTFVSNPFAQINIFATEDQVEILNPKTIYFDVTADQSEITSITNGQNVNIVLDSFSDKTFSGTVTYISLTPKPGETGSVYKVKVAFTDNLNITTFRIGMTGDAKFSLNKKSEGDTIYD
ncbi:MAG: efflux RND transporter periplasmic adaptor subunit [Patescibacteria group bacterium]